MVFNGLKGCEAAAYNYLAATANGKPIPIKEIADRTCYSESALKRSLSNLAQYGLIVRRRATPGKPYRYQVME